MYLFPGPHAVSPRVQSRGHWEGGWWNRCSRHRLTLDSSLRSFYMIFFRARSRLQAASLKASQSYARMTSIGRVAGEKGYSLGPNLQDYSEARSVCEQLSLLLEPKRMLQWKQPLLGQQSDMELNWEAGEVFLGIQDAGETLSSKLDLRKDLHAKRYPDSECPVGEAYVSLNTWDMAADIIRCCLPI